jgi:hypothetical protein
VAAAAQSTFYGGFVTSGSLFASLQSAGVLGTAVGTKVAVAVGGSLVPTVANGLWWTAKKTGSGLATVVNTVVPVVAEKMTEAVSLTAKKAVGGAKSVVAGAPLVISATISASEWVHNKVSPSKQLSKL